MLRVILAGLRARKLRLVLTSLAIVLGVGFVSGTQVLTDTLQAGYRQGFTADAGKLDVVVIPGKEELTSETLGKIRAVPGVAEAHPVLIGEAPLIGRDGKVVGEIPPRGVAMPVIRLNVTAGEAPTAAGEAVLDEATAEEQGFSVGDTIAVLDHKGARHEFRLAGIFDVGVDQRLAYGGAVVFTVDDALRITGVKRFTEIDVIGAGTSPESLRDAVASALGSAAEVRTGEEHAEVLAEANGASLGVMRIGLLLFAAVALLVAGLVIYNTFSILVAQRTREMALLRCIGATRRQVFGAVVLESAIVGLISSILGLFAGLGLGAGAIALLEATGSDLPGGTVRLSTAAAVSGLVTGLAVTVGAALLPARQATKVAPVAALRTQVEEQSFRAGVLRVVASLLLALAGGAVTAYGVAGEPGENALVIVTAGGILVFFAVLIIGPVIVRPLSRIAGRVPAWLFGVPGRLAVGNAQRNPKRSATTTIALTVGVTLITFMSVLTATLQETIMRKLDKQFPAQFVVYAQTGTVPRAIADDLRTRPEIGSVVEIREKEGKLNGRHVDFGTLTQAALGDSVHLEVTSGSLDGFGPGTVAIADHIATRNGIKVGDVVTLSAERRTARLRVAAIVDGSLNLVPPVLLPEQSFERYFGTVDDAMVLASGARGVPFETADRVVNAATQAYPAVKVSSAAKIRAQFEEQFAILMNIVVALLGLAIIISLLGIANTLTLSVHERIRESAVLRALGLTGGQLRGMISIEALVLGLVGAIIGIALGTVYGWLAAASAFNDVSLQLPVGRILLFLALSGLAAVLAALLPARRAARVSITGALSAA